MGEVGFSLRENPIRVLIADDHAVVAQALSLFLSSHKDMQVTGIVQSGRGAIKAVVADCPDVLLLDLRMPDMDGVEVLSALTGLESPPIVLILTSYPEAEALRETITLGGAGFLSKEVGLQVIPQAIRTAVAGNSILDSELVGHYFGRRPPGDSFRVRGETGEIKLSGEEHAVALLLARGMTNEEIGLALGIDTWTVKSHLTQLYEKIGVQNRTQAAIWTIRAGLWVSS